MSQIEFTPGRVVEQPAARVGMILPASNQTCELQFARLAPQSLAFHTTRARIAGKWMRPIDDLADHIIEVTETLSECDPDLLVYNCTASSMKEGRAGEQKILEIMRRASPIPAISTSAVVAEAFRALGVRSTVLITPYASNADIIAYLEEVGVQTVKSVELGLHPSKFGDVSPEQWRDLALENDTPGSESVFLSCAATRQIEAVEAIEMALGKPVVNSNQAVLWGCLTRLSHRLGPSSSSRPVGRLMRL